VPKIVFIKNVDDEIIYPKTHEDAILTKDGLSISAKIQSLSNALANKSNDGHTHDYATLTGIPTSFKANGGNADTIANKVVDDTKLGSGYLWTSQKIFNELSKIAISGGGTSSGGSTGGSTGTGGASIYTGATEPATEILWIDTANNVFKYKVNGSWITLGTDLKYS
jgi:hypothetical protein